MRVGHVALLGFVKLLLHERKSMGSKSQKWWMASMLGVLALASPALASSSSLPDIGIDVAEYVTDLGTALGTAIGVVVGLAFAFLVVWIVVRKARGAAG